jgi:hypothetical protein
VNESRRSVGAFTVRRRVNDRVGAGRVARVSKGLISKVGANRAVSGVLRKGFYIEPLAKV